MFNGDLGEYKGSAAVNIKKEFNLKRGYYGRGKKQRGIRNRK